MTIALIDADILIYEAAASCETSVPWPYGDAGEVLWTRHAHVAEAWAQLTDSIEKLAETAGATSYIACVTDTANWRYSVYADYKSNRKQSVKPMLVPMLREQVALAKWGFRREGLEGDDCMGILQTMPQVDDTVCITIDKDLKTIPGRHYHQRNEDDFVVTEAEANRFHLLQTLAGDATDGYPGCRGIGMVKAEKLIPDPVEAADIPRVWAEIIVPAYEKAGFDEAFALSQARVARILRACDYNPKTKKVIPWNPCKPSPSGRSRAAS